MSELGKVRRQDTRLGERWIVDLSRTAEIDRLLKNKPDYLTTPVAGLVRVWGKTIAECGVNLKDLRQRLAALPKFTLPELTPTARKTPHGVAMSERMSRLYGWINANGIALTSFSTDVDVKAAYPRLLALHTEAVEQAANPTGEIPAGIWIQLADGVANIMRRTPENRVTDSSSPIQGKPTAQQEMRTAIQGAMERLVSSAKVLTVAAEHSIGSMIHVSGCTSTKNSLRDALIAQDLPELAEQIGASQSSAMQAALRKLGRGRHVAATKGVRGEWSVYPREAKPGEALPSLFRVRLAQSARPDAGDYVEILGLVEGHEAEAKLVADAYLQLRADGHRDAGQNSSWALSALRDGCLGVDRHGKKGFVFVKRDYAVLAEKIRDAFSASGAGEIDVYPFTTPRAFEAMIPALLKSLEEQAREFITRTQADLTDGKAIRKQIRESEANELKARCREYEGLFGDSLKVLIGEVEAIRVRLASTMVVSDAVAEGAAPISDDTADAASDKRFQGVVGETLRDAPVENPTAVSELDPAQQWEALQAARQKVREMQPAAVAKVPAPVKAAPEPEKDATEKRASLLELD